MCSTMLNHA